jgi:antitoxin ParD1/3/4
MNIYLGEHFEKFIRDQVATGRYANASEVVREALRALEDEEDKHAQLREAIQLGIDDFEAGRVIKVDDIQAFFDGIRTEAHERVQRLQDASVKRAAS